MKMRWNMKQKENIKFMKLNNKHRTIVNDNDYNNPYDESNDKTKIKE